MEIVVYMTEILGGKVGIVLVHGNKYDEGGVNTLFQGGTTALPTYRTPGTPQQLSSISIALKTIL